VVSRVFLDANILLDLVLKRGQFAEARALWAAIAEGRFTGLTMVSSLNVCAHWLTKSFGHTTAKTVLKGLLDELQLAEPDKSVMRKALASGIKDIEDAFQFYTAVHCKADVLVTQDKGLLQYKQPLLAICDASGFAKNYLGL
jgi:predicted nucleic acid-binding protein